MSSRVYITRHAQFDENIFPFKGVNSGSSPHAQDNTCLQDSCKLCPSPDSASILIISEPSSHLATKLNQATPPEPPQQALLPTHSMQIRSKT